jgi:hypothetical protein
MNVAGCGAATCSLCASVSLWFLFFVSFVFFVVS